MANETLIRTGSVSIENGSRDVTGSDVSWGLLQAGDMFGIHVGLSIPIASVQSDGVTLEFDWPGPSQTDAPYAIQPAGDVVRFQGKVRDLLTTIGAKLEIVPIAGTVYTFQEGDSGKMFVFTAATAITANLPNSLPVGWCVPWVQAGDGRISFVTNPVTNVQHTSNFKKSLQPLASGSLTCLTNSNGSNAKYLLTGETAA